MTKPAGFRLIAHSGKIADMQEGKLGGLMEPLELRKLVFH